MSLLKNMKVQKALQDNTIIKTIIIIITSACIITTAVLYITGTSYYVKLFFPAGSGTELIYEQRKITRIFSKREKLTAIVNELLLGAVDPNIKNAFPREAKLLSLWINNGEVLLNFNKEILNGIEREQSLSPADDKEENIFYILLLQSIVHTICTEERSVKVVRFYFDGVPYKYIGSVGPIDQGLKPDWNLLKK